MKGWSLLSGVFVLLLLLNFSSAISKSDYEKVMSYEINKYFDEEPLLLSISELRIVVDYYSTVEGFSIDLADSGLSESAQLIINGYSFVRDNCDCDGENISADVPTVPVNYQAEKRCFDNDIYWYDSNGVIGVKDKECGSVDKDYGVNGVTRDECFNGKCSECRFDIGFNCYHDKDGNLINSNCVEREPFIWEEYSGKIFIDWDGQRLGDVLGISYGEMADEGYIDDGGYLYYKGREISYRNGPLYVVCKTNDIVE